MQTPAAATPASPVTPPDLRTAGGGGTLIVLLALLTTSIGIYNARTSNFTDDAGFFLRYAAHIADGHGYCWNLDEPPIWGASAPLWPAALALGIRAGLTPESAAVALGFAFTLAATAILALCALRCVNRLAAIGVCLFAPASYRYVAWAVQGMESPLTYLIVALALAALTFRWSWQAIGFLAALAVVHKLDLAPLSALLVLILVIRDHRAGLRAALLAAAAIAAAALAAWLTFGSVIPNSVAAKLQFTGSVPREWFWEAGLYISGRFVLLVVAVLSLPLIGRRPDVFVFAWAFGAVLVAAYTWRPPAEGYEWYLSSVQPILIFLAAAGAGSVAGFISDEAGARRRASTAAAICAIAGVALITLQQDRVALHHHKFLRETLEADRVAAGRWIDANTPADATVLTGFGNIAYYSHRRVIDYSFLNRKPPIEPYERLTERLQPDVLAHCHFGSPLKPADYPAPPGYRVAAVFDKAAQAGVNHFYAVVLLRDR